MRPEIRTYQPPVDTHVAVSTQGDVSPDDVDYARSKLGAALRAGGRHVLFVRARLVTVADPAVGRPASVHVTVDLRGHPVQVTSAGSTMTEAVDLARDRLEERLRRSADRRLSTRRRAPHLVPAEEAE